MRIIDPHVHVWKNDPQFPWAKESANPPKFDATPEILLDLMEANGVEKTVLVQVIHYRWDNTFVSHSVKKYPHKFVGIGRINPQDPSAADHLSYWVEEHGLQGIRLSPSTDPSGDWFSQSDLMDPIFSRAEKHNIPILILTRPKRLADLANILDRHNDVDVVVDHMADCSINDIDQRQQLIYLARYPRVFVKISHTWSISQIQYPWVDTYDLVKSVHQSFGAERIMWGTDWPVCLGKASYAETLSVVKDEMSFLTTDELNWVLGRTALRVWSWPSVEAPVS